MTQKRLLYTILIALGIVLVVSAGYLFYTKYRYQDKINQSATAMTVFNEKYQGAQALQNSGDYTGAVDAFTSLLQDAPDKASLGKLKIFIAANLLLRNQGDDQAKGIQTYKEVLNDPQMPAYVRAKVLTDLANLSRNKDEAFYVAYFSEQPFRDFLPASGTSGTKMSTVYLKLLQLSDETHPNSYAEYLIAGNYYAPLLVNNTFPGTTTPEQAAKIMQEYVKKGDALAPIDESSYKPSIMLQRYLYRALALNASNRVLENVSTTDRENAFKLVLSKGAQYANSTDYPAITVLMKSRFFYANFLMEFFGKDRHPEIVTLLKPFGKAASGSDPSFKETRSQYTYLASAPDTDFVKTRALDLAEISPEFKDFLISLGLKP